MPVFYLRVINQMLSVLAYLHRKGIVHCHSKPENILCSSTHNFYLSCFGSVHYQNQVEEVGGTPEFVAPEVWNRGPYS